MTLASPLAESPAYATYLGLAAHLLSDSNFETHVGRQLLHMHVSLASSLEASQFWDIPPNA